MRRLPLLIAALAMVAPAAALAQTSKAPQGSKPGLQCFNMRDWNGWKADGDKGMYIRVRLHDIYRIDFSAGCPSLTSPNSHLVTGSTTGTVCSALDLDIKVSDPPSFTTPCIASKLTKLDAAAVAALPKKLVP